MSEITNFRGETVPVAAETQGDAAVRTLINRVGERVRRARELKGIPRRVLSETSGVSPRYLALLEAGEGNISIGLLQRVAVALEHRVEWLLSEDDPWTSETQKVANLFRAASADQRSKVLEILAPQPECTTRGNRIALIGLRGAGKSTLGSLLGERLSLPFVELNREIEDHAGMPVTEVMAFYGQEGYRRLEAQALARIIETHDSMILAVAGGIVTDPEVFKTLLAHFHTVWIKASPSEHMERVRAQGDLRPMAGNPEAMEQLKFILTSREALYEQASTQLETSGCSVAQSADDLQALIETQGFLR
ncbi:helix-turn-helix transcriptional regulator [Pararhodobacter oceanensis]|uniref:Shikimate kinase n=1 Tax=Pararhodobacter oceanensis TaxID=2172121 RepID=A0A2T8HVE1_9RHOB|nr:helix-turn-helix transcriptional regulator [Pararhodobacter oceanensis]PVH29381.1 transcriptional regulator [Pararhodobacter oceanensis]